jgi:hypothetical protein
VERDRLLNILRWVVTPIVLAIIAGYFQSRTSANTAQTRATYDTLAPNVLELQGQVAQITGRIEELSKRPVFMCTETSKPVVRAPKPDSPKPTGVLGLGGYAGKTEPMVDHIAPPPPEPTPSPKKIPARFDDMVQQQQKY